MTFLCILYATLCIHLCIVVFVYIHVFFSVHQPTQPVVLIFTIYLCIPHATCTVLSVLNKLLNC